MTKTLEINFDMDGTLANFYGVEGWLEYLINSDATPYAVAKPLFNFSALARQIHRLQNKGYTVNIISWYPKVVQRNITQRLQKLKKNGLQNICRV